MRRLLVFPSSIGTSSSHGGLESVCRVVIFHADLMGGKVVANQVSISFLNEMANVGRVVHLH